jgi:hypothetical protein
MSHCGTSGRRIRPRLTVNHTSRLLLCVRLRHENKAGKTTHAALPALFSPTVSLLLFCLRYYHHPAHAAARTAAVQVGCKPSIRSLERLKK